MANHLRCPMCGRNVRYSRIARKVVRHQQIKLVDEPYYSLATRHTELRTVERPVGVCQVSGLKEHEVRKLAQTVHAFGRDPEFVSGVTG